ncbi:MAG: hypothetical protein LKI34_06610 [Bifidobacterium tibiigranuli]|uniref:hypothetical protein n=1 Tax=Bifidobacterium tibiigranuli TaxID=2172043 RepID=UPI0026ED71AD|nr:hypothetical protein [Bifidobacterium tibiigranuli]MCI1673865.1 hypothetical protein [Bifidobacterium tibiigranuli]MCI1712114.1 hypothetical protein [Bifidobacterium tibiigranuli]
MEKTNLAALTLARILAALLLLIVLVAVLLQLDISSWFGITAGSLMCLIFLSVLVSKVTSAIEGMSDSVSEGGWTRVIAFFKEQCKSASSAFKALSVIFNTQYEIKNGNLADAKINDRGVLLTKGKIRPTALYGFFFVVLLFVVFFLSLYLSVSNPQKLTSALFKPYFGILMQLYASAWALVAFLTVLLIWFWLKVVKAEATANLHDVIACIAKFVGLGGVAGFLIGCVSPLLLFDESEVWLLGPNSLLDLTAYGALAGSVIALPICPLHCLQGRIYLCQQIYIPLSFSLFTWITLNGTQGVLQASPSSWLKKMKQLVDADPTVVPILKQLKTMHSPTEQSAVSLVNSDWRALLDLFSTGDYGLLLSNKIYFMVTMFVIWIVFAIMLVRQFFQANALRRDSERKQNQPVEDGLNMSA